LAYEKGIEMIGRLVEKYQRGRDGFIADMNETQLRTDFLDPFFELLGWDIKNSEGIPTSEREVLVEEPLKADASSNTKKPDFTFRLFSERKFFLEAKRPSVKIEENDSPARQVRRYGFTAKLKISVLSNFEYLAIYDCSEEVMEDDFVSNSRVRLYHYTEYVDSFEEIKELLGREAVYAGRFDETWQEIEAKLKLFSVDNLFLDQINSWRLVLGKEVFQHKPELTEEELNDIVQRYINSIIFLRVCEDRNLEDYKTLLNFADKEDFNSLVRKFQDADIKYNSGLFNQVLSEELIENTSSAFWTIIKQLYFPNSTYSFAVFASDVLGNIYEVFLGEQLKIDGEEVLLVRKPEHVDRDIVTTPTYIVQAILKETVFQYCQSKTDEEILNSTFADIACGSGVFLLETYQLINDILVDYYLANSPGTLIQTSVETFKLPFSIKKRILENCIFGVDKDYNAVEACKFGLLLKLLEDENNSTVSSPVLPNLDERIQYGNSLIESSETTNDNRRVINPFDFGDNRFDVIVGNPPYMSTEHMRNFTPLEVPIYKRHFNSAYKQFDKYFLFIERGVELLRNEGYFGFIVPSKFAKVGAGTALRTYLQENKYVRQIVSFGANQIFPKKTTYTCLLNIQKSEQENLKYLEVGNLSSWKLRSMSEYGFDSVDFEDLDSGVWVLVPEGLKETYRSIIEQSRTLLELVGRDNINNGIQTSKNTVYIQVAEREDETYYYFTKDDVEWKVERELTRPYFKTSRGVDNLNTYRALRPNAFVIYPYLRTDDGVEFITIDRLEEEFTETFRYFSEYEDVLRARSIRPVPVTDDEWYRYGRHMSLENCDVPEKIVIGVNSNGNKYAIDNHSTLISSGGTAGYCMITLPSSGEYSIFYIQALLNSKYLEWFSALIGEVFRGGYIARGTKVLNRLPIRTIDFTNIEDKLKHDNIVATQQSLISLQSEIDNNNGNLRLKIQLKREFDTLIQQQEDQLKDLYNLGENDNLIPLISEIYATN